MGLYKLAICITILILYLYEPDRPTQRGYTHSPVVDCGA